MQDRFGGRCRPLCVPKAVSVGLRGAGTKGRSRCVSEGANSGLSLWRGVGGGGMEKQE